MAAEKLDLAALPPSVRAVLQRLQQHGGRAWLVGGTVRDLLLARTPADFDIATDLLPAQVAVALPGSDLQDQRLGACRIKDAGVPIVVTTLRREADYRDHRRPSVVEFTTDVAIDAARRDFTVNAIYAHGATGELIDLFGGSIDLVSRRLCTVGPAAQRFGEDALRLLRALRFASRFDLTPDADLVAAARAQAPLLAYLSAERVYEELTRTFTGPRRGAALRRFVDWGFGAVLLPEVAAMAGVPQPPQYHPEGCVLTHVALVLDCVPDDAPILSWAAVLHDVGKPPTFDDSGDRIRFSGHDTLSAKMAEAVLTRLHAPAALREAVAAICRDHIRIAGVMAMRPRRREQWLRSPLFPLHLEFHRADCLGSHGNLSIHAAAAAALVALPPLRPPLVTGADVLACGIAPGPAVGRLLAAVEHALDANEAVEPTRSEALAVLARLAREHVKNV